MRKLTPIEWNNQRIMTTKLVAECYGTEERRIERRNQVIPQQIRKHKELEEFHLSSKGHIIIDVIQRQWTV